MLRARLHLFERGGERPVHEVGPGLHFAVVFILKTLERILVFGSQNKKGFPSPSS